MRMVIDPRCGRKTKHDHAEILTYLVVGYLAGRDSVRRCLKWCENHIDFLRQHLELKNGIASPATVSRILGNIDEEIFCLAFIEWMTGILNTKGINIAIDVKALCGSTEKIRNRQAPYILDLITLCKKQKEIKTVGWLEQVRIPMEKDKDGRDITPAYEDFIKNGTVRRPRITAGDNLTDDIHQVGLISSRRMSAKETLETKRNHWKIENSLHHVLDDLFREDRSSARKSKNNLAVNRKIAYNLLLIAILRETTLFYVENHLEKRYEL